MNEGSSDKKKERQWPMKESDGCAAGGWGYEEGEQPPIDTATFEKQ